MARGKSKRGTRERRARRITWLDIETFGPGMNPYLATYVLGGDLIHDGTDYTLNTRGVRDAMNMIVASAHEMTPAEIGTRVHQEIEKMRK